MREQGDEEHRRRARFRPESAFPVCAWVAAFAVDVVGRAADEPWFFFTPRDSVVSGSEFCRAGQRVELCRRSVWRKGVFGGAHVAEPLDRDSGGVRRRKYRLVE